MGGAFRVLHAELVRLLTSTSAWVGISLAFLVPILRVWAAALAYRAKEVRAIAEGRQLSVGLEEGRGWAMLVDGWRAGLMLATALLLVQSARAIAGDRETGVLRLAVTRSASRTGAVVGRALLGPVMVLGLVAITGFGAWFAAVTLGKGDFGNLVQDGYEIFGAEGAAEVRRELLRALVTAGLGLMAVHAFGLLASALIRGPLLALAASLAALVLWDVFKEVVGESRWFVFASHAPTFADESAMKEMAGFSRGMSDAGIQDGIYRAGLLFPAAEAVLFVALACLALRRQRI